jgi:leucyl aminopeptidase
MPLHPDYAEHVKGRYAQLTNSPDNKPKGHAISGAEFLHHFSGGLPWAHLDIAGVGHDLGKPYAAKGASGWGVRLLTELLSA